MNKGLYGMKIDQKRLQSMYPEMKRDFAEKMNQMIRALLKETESNQYKHLVQNMHNKEEKK